MGFEGWAEMALEVTRRRRLLAAAGSRLVRPLLVASYKRWHADWATEQAATVALRHRKELSDAHWSREGAEGDARRLRLESEKALAQAVGERGLSPSHQSRTHMSSSPSDTERPAPLPIPIRTCSPSVTAHPRP